MNECLFAQHRNSDIITVQSTPWAGQQGSNSGTDSCHR